MLFILSYIFMYLVILDEQNYALKLSLETVILLILWVDTVLLKYIKSFDRREGKKEIIIIDERTILLLLMTIDLFIFASKEGFN